MQLHDQDQYSLLCQQIVGTALEERKRIKKNSVECECYKLLRDTAE